MTGTTGLTRYTLNIHCQPPHMLGHTTHVHTYIHTPTRPSTSDETPSATTHAHSHSHLPQHGAGGTLPVGLSRLLFGFGMPWSEPMGGWALLGVSEPAQGTNQSQCITLHSTASTA